MSTVMDVRIRLAVWPDGSWIAYGSDEAEHVVVRHHEIMTEVSPPGQSIHWVNVRVPLPAEISGSVEGETT